MYDHTDGPADCPVSRQARNTMVPLIGAIIEKARRLADDLEAVEVATRKK